MKPQKIDFTKMRWFVEHRTHNFNPLINPQFDTDPPQPGNLRHRVAKWLAGICYRAGDWFSYMAGRVDRLG